MRPTLLLGSYWLERCGSWSSALLPSYRARYLVVAVSDTVQLAEPLTDVRDVLETFRRHRLLMADWAVVLADAADVLEGLSAAEDSSAVACIAAEIRGLVAQGLKTNEEAVGTIADEVARILAETVVPGLPRPEDAHWEFT